MGIIILEKIATCMFRAEDGAAVSYEILSIYRTRRCHIPEIHHSLYMSAGQNDTGLMCLFRVRLWKRRW